jgi:hypothetical protein
MLLNVGEEGIRSHLIFEPGFCITARKYLVLLKIYKQIFQFIKRKIPTQNPENA